MTNQSEEILNYIRTNPHSSVDDIVKDTGWNHHIVITATRLMVEQKLIRVSGKTKWGDSRFEIVKSIEELTTEIDNFVSKLQEDLQISSPSKLFNNILLPNMATGLMGFGLVKSLPGLTSMINESIEQNRLLEEVAHITGKTTDEIKEFCVTHPYSLEMIKDMVQAGVTLNKEGFKIDWRMSFGNINKEEGDE